jgi:hypothetical protein
MGLGQSHVPRPVQPAAADPLRVGALNPGPPGVLGFERGGLLPLPRRLDRLMLRLRSDGELAGARPPAYLGRAARFRRPPQSG